MQRSVLTMVTAAAVAAIAVPAWAHPGFTPNTVEAGQTTEVELAMAHGCDDASGGESEPTTVVAVQIPATIADVVPLEREGWTTILMDDGAGRVESVEWAARPGTVEPEPPSFRLRVTPDTREALTTIPFVVYQGCESGEYRWGAGDNDEPSVDLEVLPGTYQPAPGPDSTATSPSSATDAVLSETASPDEDATAPPDEAATTDDDAASPVGPGDVEPSGDRPTAIIVVLAVLAASSVAGVAWLRRQDRAA